MSRLKNLALTLENIEATSENVLPNVPHILSIEPLHLVLNVRIPSTYLLGYLHAAGIFVTY